MFVTRIHFSYSKALWKSENEIRKNDKNPFDTKGEVVPTHQSPCPLRRQPQISPTGLMLRHPNLSYEAIRGALVVLKTARLYTILFYVLPESVPNRDFERYSQSFSKRLKSSTTSE